MTATYREILQQLRLSFQQPVSHCVHDACFVFSILHSLDQIDAMKSDIPLLGKAKPLDYTAALRERIPTDPSARDELLAHSEYNRGIFHYVRDQAMKREGVLISMTDCYRQTNYGEPIAALKTYVLSPFIDEAHVKLLVPRCSRRGREWTGRAE